jgi:hypothetical protein
VLCGDLSVEQRFQLFIHLKKQKDLLALRFPQGSQLIRLDSGCDLAADVVDAEHMPRQEPAS